MRRLPKSAAQRIRPESQPHSEWRFRISLVPKYSIVVPFHNEEENVTRLYDRVKDIMEHVGDSFEMVFVDDGSRDRTYRLMEEIAAVDSRVLLVKLRRNFGQTSATRPQASTTPQANASLRWMVICSTTPSEIPTVCHQARRRLRRRQWLASPARR